MAHSVDLTNVAQKLVAQTFAFGRALDQTGNVRKFESRADNFLRVEQRRDVVDALIRTSTTPTLG